MTSDEPTMSREPDATDDLASEWCKDFIVLKPGRRERMSGLEFPRALDDSTPSTPQEPRGAILPAVEPARGFSDADLLRRRTAALNRTSAENERLRAEVERLRKANNAHRILPDRIEDMLGIDPNDPLERLAAEVVRWKSAWQGADREWAEDQRRSEAAEAKLRDVEALADEWITDFGIDSEAWRVMGPQMMSVPFVVAQLRAVLARSQAPQAPADSDAECGGCGGSICPECGYCDRSEAHHGAPEHEPTEAQQ